ncbi:MAG: bile acid:sodium symporter [Candidatus Latescibacteria bacterium]|nr:bile acid:sodium symporter [Candidatus Latescibacterota bacterium]
MDRLPAFLKKHFLPIGLVSVALVGLRFPWPGIYLAGLPTQYVAVSIIFICSGMLLRTSEVRNALSAWKATAWGSFSILLFTPLIGAALALQIPIAPEFQLGLALFCCMPTTLSSGIALTIQARGNMALALLLTVLTNTLGVFTVPFVLERLLEATGKVELSGGELLLDLCLSILLPLALGRLLQQFLGEWIGRNRTRITMTSNLALISIPWMKFSQSAERLSQLLVSSLVLVVLSGVLIHLLYLALNDGASRLLRLPLEARKAVVILASQKTLPVAMTVLAFLPVPAETKGLIAIPCITSHLSQIFLDAFLATRWGHSA